MVDFEATAAITDDDLEEALDDNRVDVYHQLLYYVPSYSVGIVEYKTFYAFARKNYPWEDTPIIQDSNGNVLTPNTINNILGKWDFTTTQSIPLYITGTYFDIYGAAVDVLEKAMLTEALSYDVQTDDQKFMLSQKLKGVSTVLKMYQKRKMPRSVGMDRGDVNVG
jgi:hypothetical protein